MSIASPMRSNGISWSCVGVVVCLGAATTAGAGPLADPLPDLESGAITVRLEPVASGLVYPATPTKVVSPGDGSGRLFVAGLGGVITMIDSGGTTSTFLDTTTPDTEINPASFGTTSMAFHPDFADDQSPGHRRFYVIVTELQNTATADFGSGAEHQDVIYEWMVDDTDPDAVDPLSKREILRVDQPKRDHNVVDVAFGPDGLLYISSGDGGNNPPGSPGVSDNAQDLTSIHGKILRIDPLGLVGATSANGQYSIPTENPFVDMPGIDEIYAYGLRSPYRITFDRQEGDLYVGDVGQVNIEEISRVVSGGNYGWNQKEGSFLYDPVDQSVCEDPAPDPMLIDPLGEYDHDDGRSIVGGYVYRGADAPILGGKMILADFVGSGGSGARLMFMNVDTGEIRWLLIDPAGEPLPDRIYTLGEDEDGEIYIGGGASDGSTAVIQRIELATAPCSGDIDGDGDTDVFDFGILARSFGTTSGASHADGDLDHNGAVDIFDFGDFALDFGCQP